MLHILDVIRTKEQERRERTTRRKSCQGSTVKGHYRGDNWIPEHERCAHIRVYAR